MGTMKRAPGADGADRWTGTELHWPWITFRLPPPQGSNVYLDFQGRNIGSQWWEAVVPQGTVHWIRCLTKPPPGSSILQALPGPPTAFRKPGHDGSVKVNEDAMHLNYGEHKMWHSQQPAGVPVLTTGGKQPRDSPLSSDSLANGETEAPGKWMNTGPSPGYVLLRPGQKEQVAKGTR